ncbi:MAG: DUF4175 family protein, partial [Chthoniobacteraceae bacterium]
MRTPDRKILPLIPLALATMVSATFAVDVQSAVDSARNGEHEQQQIQADSQKLVADLDATIDEYQRNSLNGEEIKNLKKVRQIISNASETEMAKILDLLQHAGNSSKPEDVFKNLSAANVAQKGVLSQLKTILDGDARQQEAQAIADEVKALADRQAANLQTGISTAQWALSGASKNDDAAIAASFEAQAAEQKAIAEDLNRLQAKIDQFAKNPNNQALADRFKKGIEDSAKVAPQINAATDLLNQKKLFEAVASEKTARDGMRQLARTISPPLEETDALRAAVDQLNKMIAQQKELMDITGKASKFPPIEQWVADILQRQKSHEYEEAKKKGILSQPIAQLVQNDVFKGPYGWHSSEAKKELPGLESQEGDLVTQSDALSQDISKIAKPASDALQSALPPMQSARGSLTDKKAVEAEQFQSDALGWLQKAKATLDQKLAEKKSDTNSNPVAQLSELQKETQKLAADQAALAQQTAAPKTQDQAAALAQQQAGLQQKAQDLQQKAAAAQAPGAAQSLDKAAANMAAAAAAANNPAQAPQAAAQQQQAAQNLAAAAAQLGKQADAAQKVDQQVAADKKELDDLAKIIELEQKIRLDTVQAASKQDKQPEKVRALAVVQQGIQKNTDDYQKTLAAAPPDPTKPDSAKTIASASSHMGDAFGFLGKADGTKAEPNEKRAIDDLLSLQTSLQANLQAAQAAAAANNPAGQPPPPDPAAQAAQAAATAAAIAQAQAQVAQAQAALAANQPAAPAASDPAAAPPDAGAPPAGAPPAGAPPAGAPPAGAPPAGAPPAGAPPAGAPPAGAPPAGAPPAGAPPAG